MNSDDSGNFEALRRLMALKRHEEPPPGYFNDFSRQVIARIRAGETDGGREPIGSSWWQRLWAALETKPIFAGAFGAGVCAVLISGILNSETSWPTPAVPGALATRTGPAIGDAPLSVAQNTDMPIIEVGSNSISSLFDQFQPQVRPVSFELPH